MGRRLLAIRLIAVGIVAIVVLIYISGRLPTDVSCYLVEGDRVVPLHDPLGCQSFALEMKPVGATSIWNYGACYKGQGYSAEEIKDPIVLNRVLEAYGVVEVQRETFSLNPAKTKMIYPLQPCFP